LRSPSLTPTTTTTTTDPPSHIDLSPLSQLESHSALTGIRAANNFSYFAATAAASRLSMKSSGGWNDQDHSPRIVTQASSKEDREKEKGDLD